MKVNKILEKAAQKILHDAECDEVDFSFQYLNDRSCLFVNESTRKMVLITVNALDAKGREVLAFGISVRKSNWKSQLKNSTEMELIGKLSSSPYKALQLNQVIAFIS
tara:strand:- start:179 stop:499 length:321 start_codon:yes stop_codon:yes gene_type:complete